jgi:hypothetical protein
MKTREEKQGFSSRAHETLPLFHRFLALQTSYYFYCYWILFCRKFINLRVVSVEVTVFASSKAGIVGSNPTQSMDVCGSLFCVCVDLCIGSGLATG